MYEVQGFVLMAVGVIAVLAGVSCFETKNDFEAKIKHYDDWREQGEIVVFQKEGETENDAIRRFHCQPGILVKRGPSTQYAATVMLPCDTPVTK